MRPDVAVIHAQQADRHGNVMLWGLSGVQKEAVLSATTAIATVEEIVDGELRRTPGSPDEESPASPALDAALDG